MLKIKIPLIYLVAKYRIWRGSPKLAAKEFSKIISITPDSTRVRYALSESFFKSGQYARSIKVIDYALRRGDLSDKRAFVSLKLKALLKSEQYEEIDKLTESLLDVGASWYELWNAKVRSALKREDFTDAVDYCGNALDCADTARRRASCLHILGYLHGRMGDLEVSEEYYRQALEVTTSKYIKRLGIGRMHQGMGWYNLAAESYEAMLKIKPDDPEVYFQLGSVYKKLSRRRDAEQSFSGFVKESGRARGVKGVDDRLIVFDAFFGKRYADSPKEIYRYMVRSWRYRHFRFIWVLNGRSWRSYWMLYLNPRVKVVRRLTREYYLAYSEAKYWVTNSRIPFVVKSDPSQVYIQCWHGTPLKRLAHSIDAESHVDGELMREQYDSETRQFDYLISPSSAATKSLSEAFNLKALGKEGVVIEEGYPRNDPLALVGKGKVRRVKRRLGIPRGKKVALYAPTWRDDSKALGQYSYEVKMNFDIMRERLSDDWIVLFRPHHFIAEVFDFYRYSGFVYDVSDVEDVNDLYVISDVLVTDYSSVFFDYTNLGRPVVFYMYDLEHYRDNLRGFYIDLRHLPGDVVKDSDDVARVLSNLNEYQKEHSRVYSEFTEKYNYLDDGGASKRVVERIFK